MAVETDLGNAWVPTPYTTYQEYVDRDDFHGGVHDTKTKSIEWFKNGQAHRDNDLPGMVEANGNLSWWFEDEIHRDGDLPALTTVNGEQIWWKHGIVHRDGNLPAAIYEDGTCSWYKHDVKVGDEKNPPDGAVFPGQLTKPARSII